MPESTEQTSMKNYLFEYQYGGSKWSFDIWAADLDEARARLRLMAHAQYCGEVHARIPAQFGWVAKAYCFIANLLRRREAP